MNKKDKKAIKKIAISSLIFLFAWFFYIFLKNDSVLSANIFQPISSADAWISILVIAIWIVFLVYFAKWTRKQKKWKGNFAADYGLTKKATYSGIYGILTFWLAFFIIDVISSNSSLNDLIQWVLDMDLLGGLIVFGLTFAGILVLNKKWK